MTRMQRSMLFVPATKWTMIQKAAAKLNLTVTPNVAAIITEP